jgi:hypothetical protein
VVIKAQPGSPRQLREHLVTPKGQRGIRRLGPSAQGRKELKGELAIIGH